MTDRIDNSWKEHDFEQVDYSREFIKNTNVQYPRHAFFFTLFRNMKIITNYAVRPKVIKVAKAQLKDSLRCYIPRPVIRSVELDEPLEHLTEMRQVVILFINVITANVYKGRLISLVDTAYKLVCE